MMKIKGFKVALIILFTYFTQILSAQAQEIIQLKGGVFAKNDSVPLQYVNVFNLNTKSGSLSKPDGSFYISAQLGDTLRFTSIGYNTVYYIVGADNVNLPIIIYLQTANYKISSVLINPFMNKNEFGKEFKGMGLEGDSSVNMALPHAEKQRGPAKGSNAAGTLLNFGGDGERNVRKQNEAIEKWSAKDQQVTMNVFKYNKDVVKGLTHLTDEEIDAFMKYCNLSSQYVAEHNDYDIAVSIKSCLKNYKKQKQELLPEKKSD